MREYTLRNDGLCNTITTVTKDNYIAVENKGYLDICINDKGKVNKKPQVTHGYAPTLVSEFHGNLPKVVEVRGAAMRGRYNSDGKTEQPMLFHVPDLHSHGLNDLKIIKKAYELGFSGNQ